MNSQHVFLGRISDLNCSLERIESNIRVGETVRLKLWEMEQSACKCYRRTGNKVGLMVSFLLDIDI